MFCDLTFAHHTGKSVDGKPNRLHRYPPKCVDDLIGVRRIPWLSLFSNSTWSYVSSPCFLFVVLHGTLEIGHGCLHTQFPKHGETDLWLFTQPANNFLNNARYKIFRGASIATPDKVEQILGKIKPTPGKNEVDLNAFVGAAVTGRSITAFAALTFVIIQALAFGTLFILPFIESLTGVDLASGYL